MRKIRWFLLFLVLVTSSATAILAQDGNSDTTEASGLIAYIGADYNVYTFNPIDNTRVKLTSDAGESKYYQWPTWANDGRLAYFSVQGTEEGDFITEVYVSEDGKDIGKLIYTGTNEAFNYAYWSPRNCDLEENCRDIAVLLSSEEAQGLFVELIRDIEEPTSQMLGVGGPFYYSWSPNGDRMLWQRNNQRLDIYDVNEDKIIDTLSQTPGRFQAPLWSPVDDRLLFGVLSEDRQSTDLVIVANGESQALVSNLEGVVSFAWSPNGNNVAYRLIEEDRLGPIFIVDAVTGETLVRSNVSGVIAFFWSPNSDYIAYLTLAASPGSFNASIMTDSHLMARMQTLPGLAWTVMDIVDGNTHRYGSFLPTRDMVYMLRYFDQFAQSHRVWSPDSRHLVYSEITPDNRSIISLLDTTQANTVPFSIGEGRIGVWSFE